jgi:hypothetical protein
LLLLRGFLGSERFFAGLRWDFLGLIRRRNVAGHRRGHIALWLDLRRSLALERLLPSRRCL